jgi:hypothetical protein
MQNIKAFQPFEPGEDITRDITKGMAYMQADTAGIGKHIQHIILCLLTVIGNAIYLADNPFLLPFPFDFGE